MNKWKCKSVTGAVVSLSVVLPLLAGQNGKPSPLPDPVRAMRYDTAQAFDIPCSVKAPEQVTENTRLKFATRTENPRDPQGPKCALLTASFTRDGEERNLLQIPVLTPEDAPSSYVSAFDPQSGAVAFCFSTRRTGCLVYEIQPSDESKERKPALMRSVHSAAAEHGAGRLPAIRTRVLFEHYGEYVGGRSRIQRLVPTQLSVSEGKWVLHAELPPKAGDRWSAGEVVLVKAIASPDAEWKSIQVQPLQDAQRACYENLTRITAAKKQWTMAEQRGDGDEVVIEQVDEYIKGGHPQCPDGGEYTYGFLGAAPACSVHGSLR